MELAICYVDAMFGINWPLQVSVFWCSMLVSYGYLSNTPVTVSWRYMFQYGQSADSDVHHCWLHFTAVYQAWPVFSNETLLP